MRWFQTCFFPLFSFFTLLCELHLFSVQFILMVMWHMWKPCFSGHSHEDLLYEIIVDWVLLLSSVLQRWSGRRKQRRNIFLRGWRAGHEQPESLQPLPASLHINHEWCSHGQQVWQCWMIWKELRCALLLFFILPHQWMCLFVVIIRTLNKRLSLLSRRLCSPHHKSSNLQPWHLWIYFCCL